MLINFSAAKREAELQENHKEPEREQKREPSNDRRERPRERTPPRDQHNDTKDSWAAASPDKQQQQQQRYPPTQPNQELENMDAKLERLKAGKKFERRMSEL